MQQILCTINARKMNNEIYRSWEAKLIEETSDYWLFVGEFDQEVVHSELGVIRRKTASYEYYWKTRWYNVFRFHEPEGDFRNFYCNVNQPPQFSRKVLDYVDLDIDILVKRDFSYQILDNEEFEANARQFNYSPRIKKKVKESVSELTELIKTGEFPFNYLQEIV